MDTVQAGRAQISKQSLQSLEAATWPGRRFSGPPHCLFAS